MVVQPCRGGSPDGPGAAGDGVITLPDGLVGFDGPLRLAVTHWNDSVWLQCVDRPGLAFTAIVPWGHFPEYEPVLPYEDQAALGLKNEHDALVLCLLAGDGDAATANLMAPVVVNRRSGQGRQVVLFDSLWSVRARLAA